MGPGCGVQGSTVGAQSAAVSPWEVGWTQLWPLSKEKWTADRPTARLNVPNGKEHAPAVVAASSEHGCMSTRSLDPAARTSGRVASTARDGSLEEFWGCWPEGLATLTR